MRKTAALLLKQLQEGKFRFITEEKNEPCADGQYWEIYDEKGVRYFTVSKFCDRPFGVLAHETAFEDDSFFVYLGDNGKHMDVDYSDDVKADYIRTLSSFFEKLIKNLEKGVRNTNSLLKNNFCFELCEDLRPGYSFHQWKVFDRKGNHCYTIYTRYLDRIGYSNFVVDERTKKEVYPNSHKPVFAFFDSCKIWVRYFGKVGKIKRSLAA
ncbi:MAG: hypothetical protein HYT27_02695 [Parcubacteria group bacterium]|nr:hypothetical protein [Parcubacteria group bacterium]